MKLQRVLDTTAGDPDSGTRWFRSELIGRVIGLRIALCLLHGWPPDQEADKEGRADELVLDWWERNHPEDWVP